MAFGGPAGNPQVTADLNTIRILQRRLDAGTLAWPLVERVWNTALDKWRIDLDGNLNQAAGSAKASTSPATKRTTKSSHSSGTLPGALG
eukprot:4416902-Amphidinium_carterae.2